MIALASLDAHAGARAVVAAHDLPAGTVLSAGDLAVAKLKIALPPDALSAQEATGATLRRAVDAGAVLRRGQLAGGQTGTVTARSAVSAQTAPHGQARVVPLLQGENAFVGLLSLDPGARVPAHRDPTEEYVYLLEGYGTLTLDGVDHDLGPGSAVYMPAQAEVSFVVSEKPVLAVQVFSDPSPASKYADWVAGGSVPVSARVGPFDVSCAADRCAIGYQGKEVAADLPYRPTSVPGAPDPLPHEGFLSALDLFPRFEGAWLMRTEDDQGNLAYRMLCIEEGYPVLTDRFGDGSAIGTVRAIDGGSTLALDLGASTPSRAPIRIAREGCRIVR